MHTPSITCLSCLLALPLAASAQKPSVRYFAHTNVGSFAKTPVRTALVTIPAGRSLPAGVSGIITGDSTTARLSLTSPTLFGVEASLYWYGVAYNTRGGSSTIAGTTQSTDFQNVVQAPETIDVHFVGNAKGRMTIFYGGSLFGTGGKASVKIDMDADGSVEYSWSLPTASKTISFPWEINGTRRIRVTGDCLAFTTATGPSSFTYSSSLRFVLTPLDGALTPFGSGCGPQLTGTMSRRVLDHSLGLNCSGAYPGKPVMFAIGVTPINVNIPGTNCPLSIDPVVLAPVTAQTTGTAFLRATMTGFFTDSILFQAVPWDFSGGKIATSNGLRLTFQ